MGSANHNRLLSGPDLELSFYLEHVFHHFLWTNKFRIDLRWLWMTFRFRPEEPLN